MSHTHIYCPLKTEEQFKQLSKTIFGSERSPSSLGQLRTTTIHEGRCYQVYVTPSCEVQILKSEAYSSNDVVAIDDEIQWNQFVVCTEILTMAELPPVFDVPKSVTDHIQQCKKLCAFSALWIQANEHYRHFISDGYSRTEAYELVQYLLDTELDTFEKTMPEQYDKWILSNT